jgi:hypothetical protein
MMQPRLSWIPLATGEHTKLREKNYGNKEVRAEAVSKLVALTGIMEGWSEFYAVECATNRFVH